jgi:hypothetical protein
MSVDTVVVAVVMFYCHFFAKVAVIRSRVTVFSDVRPFLQLRFQCFCIFFFWYRSNASVYEFFYSRFDRLYNVLSTQHSRLHQCCDAE